MHRILLATAGIPAIFPSRAIGPHLYVDGAITGNILYGARVDQETGFAAQWRAKHGNAPAPRVRYWVIFNNQLRFPPQVTRERWPDIMTRATIMATQTATVNAMRHLYAMAELDAPQVRHRRRGARDGGARELGAAASRARSRRK